MTPMIKPQWRSWAAQLGLEALVVVLSILLALFAREWWEGRETRQQVDEALRSVRAELVHNRMSIRTAADYHQRVADSLRAAARRGVDVVPPSVRPEGWTLPVDLLSTSWETARTRGLTAEIPYPTVTAIASAYAEQRSYLDRRRDVARVMYAILTGETGFPPRAQYRRLAGPISDVAAWERRLRSRYDRALEALEEAGYGPGEGGPSAGASADGSPGAG